MRTKEQIAYAAGLYEGEGTIVSYYPKRYKTPQCRFQINMTDEQPLEHFMYAVGLGYIYGPYTNGYIKNGDKKKEYFSYRVHKFEEVQAIIAMLWPWLSPRRKEQAAIALTRPKLDASRK